MVHGRHCVRIVNPRAEGHGDDAMIRAGFGNVEIEHGVKIVRFFQPNGRLFVYLANGHLWRIIHVPRLRHLMIAIRWKMPTVK